MLSCPYFCSPHYFKDVKISALALLKMVMHARAGGRLEVMGLMLGKIDGPSMVVMDTFALPVEGTETRVNAQAAAYEYMSTYIEAAKQVSPSPIPRLGPVLASCFSAVCRWAGWRMPLAGTTATPATVAGSQELMSIHRC